MRRLEDGHANFAGTGIEREDGDAMGLRDIGFTCAGACEGLLLPRGFCAHMRSELWEQVLDRCAIERRKQDGFA